jgi:hypothetical protein
MVAWRAVFCCTGIDSERRDAARHASHSCCHRKLSSRARVCSTPRFIAGPTVSATAYRLVAPLGLAGIAGASASACVLLIMGARWLGAAFTEQESKGLRSR